MANAYVIQWKSKLNGRAGRGSKLLEWEEAQELVRELNADYPDIQHEVVPVSPGRQPALLSESPSPPTPASSEVGGSAPIGASTPPALASPE